jgi:hypothetical protein
MAGLGRLGPAIHASSAAESALHEDVGGRNKSGYGVIDCGNEAAERFT